MNVNKGKIKILYFHPTVVFGGAERATANFLAGLDRSKFEVVFVSKKGVFKDLFVKKFLYIDDLCLSDSFKDIRALIRDVKTMKNLIKEESPDIIFGMLHYGCIVLSGIKFFLRDKVKVVVSPRTPSKDAINFYFKDDLRKRLGWNFMVRFFCKYPDYIIVPCEGMREECISEYKADKSKVHTIKNVVKMDVIDRLSRENMELEDVDKSFVISTSGRLAAEKNLSVLIKAVALLRKTIEVKLWIIGEGPERPFLEALASQLHILRDVVFWGFQGNPYKFIKRSDVFVHTSLFEGFANMIWEVIACGVPVIATDCHYGPGEIIDHMKNGMLVPVSDEVALMQAIRHLLEDEGLRKDLVKNAYNKLKGLSEGETISSLEAVFLKALTIKGNVC
jgi:glycosyltransferase involved in cell wall biosynthesis